MSENLNHRYPREEERLNILTHAFGFLLSLIAFPFLMIKSFDFSVFWEKGSFIIYGLSLIVLYAASTFYHISSEPKLRRNLNIFDHAAIYVLIAGSYTPFCLVALQSQLGWYMFLFVWIFALVGVVLKLFFTGRFDKLSTAIYLLMGWQVLFFIKPLIKNLSDEGLYYLIAGGLFYSIGAIFYSIGRIKYNHAIFHVFVLLGSFSHFIAIYGLK
ncbi:channel protein (hemolysin III family) [Tenacibaculum adriaticum]|uniref:Channel protein (Hemolysin III family) n=1 Tax=Tenacibaculum adriaticum TaxID=413713 RepID=A0A5S5DX86_9FLAO|nr:hemolysin III family protein [Tenacibaculum adriaticum]TYP99676.1 channel protein (hemolysin III family) [Tenacibaculum adriaticum]